MDFSVTKYRKLLDGLIEIGHEFQTVKEYFSDPVDKSIMLRHDVDDRKLHSLNFAQIQNELGITGTYYFRMVPQSYDEKVIKEIASLGHEIGYHYETMDKANGDVEKAYDLFCKELEQLSEIVPVRTVCMHGSPLSKYDNRDLWKHYDYRKLDIIGEPYFDLDFSKVLYLTDTGRRWDGGKMSIRDSDQFDSNQLSNEGRVSDEELEDQGTNIDTMSSRYSFHSTQDIIEACNNGKLPNQIMFNFHPQRWTNNKFIWFQELMLQNLKNLAKMGLKKLRL